MRRTCKVLAAFLARLFVPGSPLQRRLALEAMEDRLAAAKRHNAESLEGLKDDIRSLESRALRSKKEFGHASGDLKRVLVGEIERVFRELDRVQERANVIAANLERISAALSKIGTAKAAASVGLPVEDFRELALEVNDVFARLSELDHAANELEREKYDAPKANEYSVQKAAADATANGSAAVSISSDLARRLSEIKAGQTWADGDSMSCASFVPHVVSGTLWTSR